MTTPLGKALRTLLDDPTEFRDVVVARADARLDRLRPGPAEREQPLCYDDAVIALDARHGGRVSELLAEPELAAISEETGTLVAERATEAAFPTSFNASSELARLCYVACRLLQPTAVVETGVAYGATSAHILQALERNGGDGALHSIDWTRPAEAALHVGSAIPDRLRARWRLLRGPSRRRLPEVVRELGQVDLFVADAVHSYRAVRRELATVQPVLAPAAAVLADDVEDHAGFSEWARRAAPRWSATVQARPPNAFGVALLGAAAGD